MVLRVIDVNNLIINVNNPFTVFQDMDILTSALQQGLTPAIVVVIYLIVIKIIDNRKENIQAKLNSELVNSISNISNFITTITKSTIEKDKDKCEAAIETSFNAAAARLIKFVMDTIINNHIDINKETIVSNAKNIANAEFYNIYSVLSMYVTKDKKVSEYLDKEWLTEIETAMLNSIYNTSLDKQDKIISFTNKINFKFQNYITYIVNHAIK